MRGRPRRAPRERALRRRAGRQRPPLGPALARAAFPGSESSPASRCTSTTTASPTCCVGKRVLVLGIGNSATDIAVEASRIADATFLAMRRGAYVIPKYLGGKPTDEAGRPVTTRLPLAVQRFCSRAAEARHRRRDRLRAARARPQAARGAPDGLLGPAAAARPRRHHREAEHRSLRGRERSLRRRQREEIDLVIYCTGYKIPSPSSTRPWSRPRATGCRSTAASPRSSTRASTSSA